MNQKSKTDMEDVEEILNAELPPFPGKIRHYGKYKKIRLSEKQKKWMRENFPIFENKRLMAASGLRNSLLHKFANELNLKKSEIGMLAIRKRQAAHICKVCEENGYYDKLRRRGMGKPCLDALKVWQKTHVSNLFQIKEKNPERWKEIHDKAKANRIVAINNEKKRVRLGLPTRTKMRFVHYGEAMTRRQLSYRSRALKKGYILGDPYSDERWMIFYDDETERSELMERRAGSFGFVILPNDYEVKANHDFYITGTNYG